jgi:hydroxypyruvate reductase
LLPAPAEGISLEDKQAVTRVLMHSGATIDELNCVRKQLSRIKGGQLARATSAGYVISLIISDVIGDPLDVIASGPTVADPSSPADALKVLRKYATDADIPRSVIDYLDRSPDLSNAVHSGESAVSHHVIGNNSTALEAATRRAAELGYRVHSLGSENGGEAREVGQQLAARCLAIRDEGQPIAAPACVLSGGEPVVHLVATVLPRKGGRNQEVATAALEQLWDDGLREIVVLAGGTDGEDGPTDAAGGVVDADVLASARQQELCPADFLAVNNTYPFLESTGGLLVTGPTHTNVMDLRVALVGEPRLSN